MSYPEIVRVRQAACQHDGLFTTETQHRIRKEKSQEIIAEAELTFCVKCGYARGRVMGPWDSKGTPCETKPGQNHEDAAREAFLAQRPLAI